MHFVIFRFLFRVFFRFFYRYKAIGTDNIPSKGAVLLCSNHISNYDPPIIGCGTDRRVWFMGKQELFKIPVFSFILRAFGGFPVKRGASDKQALKKGLSILKEEGVLGIFPEGTRSKTGKLGKGMSGVGLFALKANPVVIPVAIVGPYRLFKPVKVVYGSPLDLSDLEQKKINSDLMREVTERIMNGIQSLLDKYQ